MSLFAAWSLHLAYASALYALGRQGRTARAADVLWCGWGACLLFDAAGSGDLSIPFRALIDFVMGAVLLRFVRGRVGLWAGLSMIVTMMVTALAWAQSMASAGQLVLLDVLAFGQLAAIIWGAWGDGISGWLAGLDFGSAGAAGRFSDRARLSGYAKSAAQEEGRR